MARKKINNYSKNIEAETQKIVENEITTESVLEDKINTEQVTEDKTTIDFNNLIQEEEKEIDKSFMVKVTHPWLYIRKDPSLSGEIAGSILDEGYYKIINEVNGWGQLENGNWIMLSYTKIQ